METRLNPLGIYCTLFCRRQGTHNRTNASASILIEFHSLSRCYQLYKLLINVKRISQQQQRLSQRTFQLLYTLPTSSPALPEHITIFFSSASAGQYETYMFHIDEDILRFSKCISYTIFNVSWQMTTDSETKEQYLTFVRSRCLIYVLVFMSRVLVLVHILYDILMNLSMMSVL